MHSSLRRPRAYNYHNMRDACHEQHWGFFLELVSADQQVRHVFFAGTPKIA